ncbi:hypothetical protein FB45DRAFT_1050025, partial [Roridomyces roridus]
MRLGISPGRLPVFVLYFVLCPPASTRVRRDRARARCCCKNMLNFSSCLDRPTYANSSSPPCPPVSDRCIVWHLVLIFYILHGTRSSASHHLSLLVTVSFPRSHPLLRSWMSSSLLLFSPLALLPSSVVRLTSAWCPRPRRLVRTSRLAPSSIP